MGRDFVRNTDGLWVPGAKPGVDRRAFLRTAGGIVLASSLPACGGSTIDGTATGIVAVTITGLDASANNGGDVVITPTGGGTPIPLTLPKTGGQATVPVGSYTVAYTAPANHQLAAGQQNPQTVNITEGVTTTVVIALVFIPPATSGTLQFTVTGLTGSPSTGGTVSVLRTDIGGQTATNVSLAANGTGSTTVTAGTYTLTYSAPAGNVVASGVVNPKIGVVVIVGATVPLTWAVVASTGSTPPDIYSFGFENGTSGNFNNGGSIPFLQVQNTNWAIDATVAYKGVNSVRANYGACACNVGQAFFFHDSPRKVIHIRFAYMQSNPFNKNGTQNNFDQLKLLRAKNAGVNGDPWAIEISSSLGSLNGQVLLRFPDSLPQSNFLANANLPAPNINSFVGQFFIFEAMVDMTTSGALKAQIWINDTMYFDYTGANSINGASSATPEWYQFDGTVNSMQQASSAWFDEIGFSTQKMGLP